MVTAEWHDAITLDRRDATVAVHEVSFHHLPDDYRVTPGVYELVDGNDHHTLRVKLNARQVHEATVARNSIYACF